MYVIYINDIYIYIYIYTYEQKSYFLKLVESIQQEINFINKSFRQCFNQLHIYSDILHIYYIYIICIYICTHMYMYFPASKNRSGSSRSSSDRF